MIFFSIIIPIFNRQYKIKDCIKSVLSQNFDKIEIILIDDNSTDESFKVCEEISKKENNIKLIKNKKNQGVGISRNIGLSLSEGKYILFLDSDDRLKKNSLKKIYFEFEKNKNSNFIIFDHDINIDGKLFKKK